MSRQVQGPTNQNVDIVQLSKNNLAITFNKHALVALKEGRTQLVQLKVGSRQLKIIVCRDNTLNENLSTFRQHFGVEKKAVWNPLTWFRTGWLKITVRGKKLPK